MNVFDSAVSRSQMVYCYTLFVQENITAAVVLYTLRDRSGYTYRPYRNRTAAHAAGYSCYGYSLCQKPCVLTALFVHIVFGGCADLHIVLI